MARSVQRNHAVPAYIEHGKVVDVDTETYTVSVYTQFTNKTISNISFAVPYQHYANGEGIFFMPEVGSTCWIAFPSDGLRPFILCWTPVNDEQNDFSANRPALNPGDIYLGTRDENFLILRRGGVVQLGGGPLSQRMYLPINNTIRDICENYSLNTLGGGLEWAVMRDENTTDGSRPSILRLAAREYANDEQPIALLEIGSSKAPNPPIVSSHSDNSRNILSLTINASGAAGAAKKISLSFRSDGSAQWDFEDNVTMHVARDFRLTADQDATLEAARVASFLGGEVVVESKDGAVSVRSASSIDLDATSQVTINPRAQVGGGSTPYLLATPTLLLFLVAHKHISSAPGNPTSPPVEAANLANQAHVSKTLFGK